MQTQKKLPPIHPGKILLEEFLEPMGITQYRLAKDTAVPPRRINEIVHQKRSITADTALRLGIFFNMSPHFWMNLQSRFEIEKAEDLLENKLKNEVHRYKTFTNQPDTQLESKQQLGYRDRDGHH